MRISNPDAAPQATRSSLCGPGIPEYKQYFSSHIVDLELPVKVCNNALLNMSIPVDIIVRYCNSGYVKFVTGMVKNIVYKTIV